VVACPACGPGPRSPGGSLPGGPGMGVAVRSLDPPGLRLDRLPVAEELVVGVVAAVSAADLEEAGGEVDAGQPLDLLEAELDLVTQPQRGRRARR
jgi:hypothetical protein